MDKIKHISILFIKCVVVIVILGIIYPSSGEKILGGGYRYDIESKRLFGPDIDIPPCSKIIRYKGDVIIVEQHPGKVIEEATYGRHYYYPHGRDTTYYWIIYKNKHTYLGPLMRHQLDSIREADRTTNDRRRCVRSKKDTFFKIL